ncbi:MAG: polysaccharide export protein, partial [Verrucomicrobiae bacterium]|nr:polysaccharide export protein [Verrucomicrobiae bacterium]
MKVHHPYNRLLIASLIAAMLWSAEASAQKLEGESKNYLLNPSDLLRVEVFQEPDLFREVRVAQDGSIVLPLIGKVFVGGKSVFDAERLITELYNRDYLVNPQINVTITEYALRRVNVIGQVNKPGVVIFPPEEEMVLLEAISLAGGFNRLADKGRVTLTRTLPNGKTETFTIDTRKIISGDDSMAWDLQKDDVIFVPERV